jgi:hypothetical protein
MPETIAYFENIIEVIKREISSAKICIKAAVCWFTNDIIFNALMGLPKHVSIELVICDDIINRNLSKFNYNDLITRGVKLYPHQPSKLMHNKYCIIDGKKVITGSYNWTVKADDNDENIVVTIEPIAVEGYIKNFSTLIQNKEATNNFNKQPVSYEELRRFESIISLPEEVIENILSEQATNFPFTFNTCITAYVHGYIRPLYSTIPGALLNDQVVDIYVPAGHNRIHVVIYKSGVLLNLEDKPNTPFAFYKKPTAFPEYVKVCFSLNERGVLSIIPMDGLAIQNITKTMNLQDCISYQ